jgi:fermentation-respiration switch protein FrsA (DUF1100 family)
MGAFSTFLTLAQRNDVAVAVCDSTYDSIAGFMQLHYRDPWDYSRARTRILKEAGFDVALVDAVAVAPQVTTPVIFLHAVSDTTVSPAMSRRVFDAMSGEKQYVSFKGDHRMPHAGRRSPEALGDVERFIRGVLGLS